VVKTVTQKIWGKDKSWSNFGTNFLTAAFACGSDIFPPALIVKGGFAMGKLIWDLVSNKAAYDACLRGDPNWKDNLLVYSYDPNEMIGPYGPDDNAHYIKPIHQMPYTITFENKASATAPANEVFVTDTIDLTMFDAETFSFSGFGWADNSYTLGGSNNKDFSRDVKYQVNGHDILVRVSGQFDSETGVARWAFVSLEKNGDELDDIMNGFLLPNNDNGDGEGFVSFVIEHKKNPANGSSVSNKATIVFDANDPITTNTYINTFDTDYPTSQITSVTESDGNLNLKIETSDGTSGINSYSLYIFVDDSEDYIAVSNLTQNEISFPCEPGTKYGFCVLATDNVGWNEPKDLKAEVTYTTSGSQGGTTTITLNVADAGYATFYDSQLNYVLPDGLKASVVHGYSGNSLIYETLSRGIVPAGVPVLIEASKKEAATYTLTSTTDEASYSGQNLLHGSDVATTTTADGNHLFYKLAYGPSGTSLADSFGWFWGAQHGAAFRIDGHRAWLALPKSDATRGYLIDGSATGIERFADDGSSDGEYRDLQGRSIEKPTRPGIYLRGNRKIIVK